MRLTLCHFNAKKTPHIHTHKKQQTTILLQIKRENKIAGPLLIIRVIC